MRCRRTDTDTKRNQTTLLIPNIDIEIHKTQPHTMSEKASKKPELIRITTVSTYDEKKTHTTSSFVLTCEKLLLFHFFSLFFSSVHSPFIPFTSCWFSSFRCRLFSVVLALWNFLRSSSYCTHSHKEKEVQNEFSVHALFYIYIKYLHIKKKSTKKRRCVFIAIQLNNCDVVIVFATAAMTFVFYATRQCFVFVYVRHTVFEFSFWWRRLNVSVSLYGIRHEWKMCAKKCISNISKRRCEWLDLSAQPSSSRFECFFVSLLEILWLRNNRFSSFQFSIKSLKMRKKNEKHLNVLMNLLTCRWKRRRKMYFKWRLGFFIASRNEPTIECASARIIHTSTNIFKNRLKMSRNKNQHWMKRVELLIDKEIVAFFSSLDQLKVGKIGCCVGERLKQTSSFLYLFKFISRAFNWR